MTPVRLHLSLGATVALLATLPQSAAAQTARVLVDAAHRTVVLTAGPFHLPAAEPAMADMPHEMMMMDTHLPVARFAWPLDTWLRGAAVAVIDGHGRPLPRRLLHHLSIENFDRRQLVYPVVEQIMGFGQETQDVSLPHTIGIPMKAGQRVGVWVMWDNETSQPLDDVYLRLTLRWTAPNQRPRPIDVLPFFVDANLHVAGRNTFDVPPGGGSKVFAFTLPVSGHLLGASGHLHDHGVSLRLEDGETGKAVVTVKAKRDSSGQLVGVSRELLALRGEGPHLRAGHPYRLVVRYDNPSPDTLAGVMGIMGGLFAPDDIRQWPPIDGKNSDYVTDLRDLSPDQLPEAQPGAPLGVALDDTTHPAGAHLWRPLVLGSLSVVLTSFADEGVRAEMQEDGGPDALAAGRTISRWSPPLALGLGAGLLGAGLATHQPSLAHTGRDALIAMGAAGFLTDAVKIAVGRARPEANRGSDYFAPFGSLTHDNSFPSGHTSQAFALAAVIAAHSHRPLIRYAAFGAATAVGIARVAADRHFASDVVGGAILGIVVGRGVVHHFAAGGSLVTLDPFLVPGCVGLTFNRRF